MGEPTIRLESGETAIIGYGSLLSAKSLEKTLTREYDGPFIPCRIDGWRRSWDIAMPNQMFFYVENGERIYPENILYLNVRPEATSLMNCIVFVVRSAELEAMHQREWIYHHPNVADRLRGVRLEGGEALMYVAKPEYILRNVSNPRHAAVRASYLRILEDGLSQRDPAFRAEYEKTTDPVPAHLVIEDVLDPSRRLDAQAGRA